MSDMAVDNEGLQLSINIILAVRLIGNFSLYVTFTTRSI